MDSSLNIQKIWGFNRDPGPPPKDPASKVSLATWFYRQWAVGGLGDSILGRQVGLQYVHECPVLMRMKESSALPEKDMSN